MRLRTKISIITLLVLITCLGVYAFRSSNVVTDHVAGIEYGILQESLHASERAIAIEGRSLKHIAQVYASSIAEIASENPLHEDSASSDRVTRFAVEHGNVIAKLQELLSHHDTIRLATLFAPGGQPVWQWQNGTLTPDAAAKATPLPLTLLEHSATGSGFAFVENTLMVVAVYPVTLSSASPGETKEALTLLLAQPLSEGTFADFPAPHGVTVETTIFSQNTALGAQPLPVAKGGGIVFSRTSSASLASMTLHTLHGTPALLLRASLPHEKSAAKAVMHSNIITVLLLAVAIFTSVLMMFEHLILKRLNILTTQLSNAEQPQLDAPAVTLKGNDEFSRLAEAINTMVTEQADSKLFLAQTLHSLPVGVALVDKEQRIVVDINPAAERMLQTPRKLIVGHHCHGTLCASQHGKCPVLDMNILLNATRRELIRSDGTAIPVMKTVQHITQNGRAYLLETFVDISALERAQQALKDSESRYRTIFMNTGTASVMLGKRGTILLANSEFLNLIDVQSEYEILGTQLATVWDESDPLAGISFDAPYSCDATLLSKRNAKKHVTVTVAPIPASTQAIVSLLDISARVEAELLLEQQAFHDSLTGLPNRQLLNDRLSHALENASRNKIGRVAILMLDLDGFKIINDSLGHEAGDILLQQVAQRLRKTLRDSDTVARLGGDEFAIIAENDPSERGLNRISQKILETLVEPFFIKGNTIHVGTSIGISIFPEDGWDPETLIRNADLAMYRAKADGKNTYRFYTEDLNRKARHQLELEHNLRQALRENQFQLAYQPKFNILSEELVGMEALIRWNDPKHGITPPAEFIPFAETCGLIVPIDLWVLEEAARQTHLWNAVRETPLIVAVNLSAWHFHSDKLPEQIATILSRTGLPASHLEIELTETVVLQNLSKARHIVRELAEMGIRLALDDFGTGYSSLNYLRSLPFDTLKLDWSFINGLRTNDPDDAFIVKTMIDIGKQFGMDVVAEGVEVGTQLEQLTGMGCMFAQGELFSAAVSQEQFTQAIQHDQPFNLNIKQQAG